MESTYARGGIQDRISPGAESRHRGQMQPALWRQLVTAETPERYCQSWLALQCGLISGVTTGVVMLQRSADTALTPVAFWPEVPQDQRHLAEAAERALLEGRGVVLRRESSGLDEGPPQVRYHLAYPVQVAGRSQSIIALDLAPRSAPRSTWSCGNCSGARPGSPCSFSASSRPCRAPRRGARRPPWHYWQRCLNARVCRQRQRRSSRRWRTGWPVIG